MFALAIAFITTVGVLTVTVAFPVATQPEVVCVTVTTYVVVVSAVVVKEAVVLAIAAPLAVHA